VAGDHPAARPARRPAPRPEPTVDIGPLHEALAVVGDRWSLLVVEALLVGEQRFSDLSAAVPGIAPNTLTARLKQLEADGLVVAVPYSERPPRVAYRLTAPGSELAEVVRLLAQWGARRSGRSEPLRHEVCGTALEARWWCPTCHVDVADAEELGFA
jgi:DNA-binding HxlR family transcriptional regulator